MNEYILSISHEVSLERLSIIMNKERNIMKNLFKSLLVVSLLLVNFGSSTLYAKVDVEAQKKLLKELNEGVIPHFSPEEQHPRASQLITQILSYYHYRKPLIDDSFSEQVFDSYLDALDSNRNYLLTSDVNDFKQFRTLIDNAIRQGDVRPAYSIFNTFLVRWVERYQFALNTLDTPIDFNLDEDYYYDRTEGSWATTTKELDEIWRKRVKNDVLNLKLAGKELSEIKDLLSKRYKAGMRRMAQSDSEDVFRIFMDSVASTVEPHTNYLSPRDAENFDIRMKLSLDGIGAMLQSEDVYTKITGLISKGPADKTGEINVDDQIVAVGQGEKPLVDVIGWRLDEVVDLIRGEKGTTVRLEVLPKKSSADGTSKVVSIVRDTVKLEEQSAKAEVIEVIRNGVTTKFGVIKIPTFYIDFEAMYQGKPDYRSTTRDVRALIKGLEKEKVAGIIIDLRFNGGGALIEATQLTGLFINKGPVVQQRSYKNEISVSGDTDVGIVYDGPLAVLVNRFSASASEIFAAAIQDYGRGLVIGGQTFGKGTVQTIRSLDQIAANDLGMGILKYTISKFYRITGDSTQHKGVLPDISYPTAIKIDEYGESSEKNALPWDTISPVDYLPVANLTKLFPMLNAAHKKRVATDKEFMYLIDDIKEYMENSDTKSVSLNLVKRKVKRKEIEDKILERENKRRVEKGLKVIADIDEIDEIEDNDAPDPRLDETAEILQDYIQLLDGRKIAYVNQSNKDKQLEN
ncbi:MAG: carboxyl-terminal processing protease [Enterobacterales bacterium]|jgi:carboxyl-terminal processing protease